MNGRSLLPIVMLVTAAVLTSLTGIAASAEPLSALEGGDLDRSLKQGIALLVAGQSADGSWRASRYPALADGPSLTALVLRSLCEHRQSAIVAKAWRRGIEYLARISPKDDIAELAADRYSYPLYTAAIAAETLAAVPAYKAERGRWIDFLVRRQMTEPLGWQPADDEYGGWSYTRGLPARPKQAAARSPLDVANLSATMFALEALRAAGRPASDSAIKNALRFVKHCQNYTQRQGDPRFDDGGFFFVLDDAARNKAGIAGSDTAGRVRFRSYASATADGLRALRLCGLADDDPRLLAARDWLGRSLGELRIASGASPTAGSWHTASFYYACSSLGSSLDLFSKPDASTLAAALVARQQPDGSWSNPAVDLREDEPLVATSLALAALSRCRARLLGQ